MSDNAKHLPLQVGKDSGEPGGAVAPRQKVWVTPKVITSTLDDTEAAGSVGADNSAQAS